MFQNSPGALLFLFPKHGFSLRGYAVIPGCRTDLAALLPGTRVAVRTSPGGTKNTAVSRPVPRVLPADATKIFSIQNHQFLKVKRRLPRAFSFSREIGTDQVNFPGSARKRPGHSPRRPLFPARSGLPASPAVWFPRVSCLTANIINYIFRCYSPLYENDQSPEHRWPCERKGSPPLPRPIRLLRDARPALHGDEGLLLPRSPDRPGSPGYDRDGQPITVAKDIARGG